MAEGQPTRGSGVSKRGFASMDPERQREIARKGGASGHTRGVADLERLDPPARRFGEGAHAGLVELARAFGMDRLALRKAEDKLPKAHRHGAQGLQVHLHARLGLVPDRPMGEGVQIEVRPQVAVGPRQHVQVEAGGHALRVVIGWDQDRRLLDQIDAQNEQGVRPQHLARVAQQGLGGLRHPARRPARSGSSRWRPSPARPARRQGRTARPTAARPAAAAPPPAGSDSIPAAGDRLEQVRSRRVIEPLGRQALGLGRQAGDQIATKRLMFVVALAPSPRLVSVRRQPHAGEGPSLVRIEEVAIGRPRVARRSGEGAAAQHHLIGHELAVVLGRRAFGRTKAGVRGIGAGGPLPHLAIQVGEGVRAAARRMLPLRLGRQAPTRPPREGVGLVEADMTHRRRRIDRPPPPQRHHRPAAVFLTSPVERRRPALRLNCSPAVAQPQIRPRIAAPVRTAPARRGERAAHCRRRSCGRRRRFRPARLRKLASRHTEPPKAVNAALRHRRPDLGASATSDAAGPSGTAPDAAARGSDPAQRDIVLARQAALWGRQGALPFADRPLPDKP
uniref:DUF4157 domain-containing protein n=1 Tax=Parastrongyloides trichosuri TaxID=131310 RepID=A0A0N4Z3F5_PARTI